LKLPKTKSKEKLHFVADGQQKQVYGNTHKQLDAQRKHITVRE
jgi:hypothetical protein